MKILFASSRFKKDYKRFRNNPQKKAALKVVLNLLANEQPIPPQYKPHMLQGNYKDFLLIWIDAQSDIIELVRLGSHSELFG